jgi:ABC-type Mn2+/Zn2+ transport system ATPase subunit
MNDHSAELRCFDSYEAREEAFSRSIFNLIPCKCNGPRRFWEDFGHIARHRLAQSDLAATAYITSNPRDCLAFGSPQQVLGAVRMVALRAGGQTPPSVEAAAEDFGLGDQLHQPVRTLSGGETVKLALAKALISKDVCTGLNIASPFCWLSRQNSVHLDRVVAHYRRSGRKVALFALSGENSREPAPAALANQIGANGPHFEIHLKNARIPLGTVVHTITGTPAWAAVEDVAASLQSPCLLKGDNGQGKSLVARTLCGALRAEGTAAVTGPVASGKARLLFQDIITQTLLRSFPAIGKSQRCRHGLDAGRIYEEIRRLYGSMPGADSRPKPWDVLQAVGASACLLEIKILLAAVRLCESPPALILDEPDWGLTRPSALALVTALIQAAHGLRVPVVLISHKPWWGPLARSVLRVGKAVDGLNLAGGERFRIQLKPENA